MLSSTLQTPRGCAKSTSSLPLGPPGWFAVPGPYLASYRHTQPQECPRTPRLGYQALRSQHRMQRLKRKAANVLAFVEVEDAIKVTLDAYKVLGISRVASKDSINRAYDKLVNTSPEAGVSQELLCSRALVLKSAADTLLDASARRTFDQTGLLDIPRADLPGAIALLVEANDPATALEWGQAWLTTSAGDPCARDVAVCMATAHCDVAALQMERSPDRIVECSEGLQTGLALLRTYNAGLELQEEIQGTLKELAPKIALQLISQPKDDTKARIKGVALLKEALWRDGEPVASFPVMKMGRTAFLETARAHLTAAEQIQLFEGELANAGIANEEVYDTAIAYVAEGIRTFTPAHVKTAARLLDRLDDKVAASGRKRASDLDVTVELAVCKLLLGDVDAAEQSLGLSPASERKPDPGVRQFVMDACEDGSGDLLPGLYKLAQQWVSDVASQRFFELKGVQMDLDNWFNNPRVSLYLQVADKSRQLRLGDAGRYLRSNASSFLAKCLSLLSLVWGALLAALKSPLAWFRRTPPAQDSSSAALRRDPEDPDWDGQSVQSLAAGDVLLPIAAGERPPHGRIPVPVLPLQTQISGYDEDLAEDIWAEPAQQRPQSPKPRIRQEVAVPLSAVENQTVGALQQQISESIAAEDEDDDLDGMGSDHLDAPSPPRRRLRRFQQGQGGSTALALPEMLPMDGEREMWVSYRQERQQGRLYTVVTSLALVAAAIYASFTKQGPFVRSTRPAPAMASVTSASQPVAAEHSLSVAAAHKVLLDWERIKADATGKHHKVERLPEILEGTMLREWKQGANKLKSFNLHYQYDLENLQVLATKPMGDGRALVAAIIEENEQLRDSSTGQLLSTARRTFNQEFQFVKKDNGWRIVADRVV